jgi:AraC-like DNA-binding protein
MQQQDFTLPILYLRHLADQLQSAGVDTETWLHHSGLNEAQLRDPGITIPYSGVRQLILDALALTAEPALGLLVGRRLLARTHGMLGYAVTNSGTLRQAVELFERYTRLRTSLISISQTIGRRELRVCFDETHPLGELKRPLLEAIVLSVKNVMDSISLGACQISTVAFSFAAPPYTALAHDLFGCTVRYAQSWTGFAIPVQVLDVPLKQADPAAFQEAALICQRELDKLTATESMATRVRRLLLDKQQGFPSLQVTARLFHLTQRTLHRRLLDEGTSFRIILEDVRHTLAVEHMKSGRFTIEELAYVLGYSDLANFRRAFKRWEAIPPSVYRTRHAATAHDVRRKRNPLV